MANKQKLHFTYKEPDAKNLQQGDLLTKTSGIMALLNEIHPHYYKKSDYTHFLVLTQSCDLVRREEPSCKAKYISLACVRPLELVISREIQKKQTSECKKNGNICDNKDKEGILSFIDRLLNNNEPEYFYLEPDGYGKLTKPSCAFLRLSIAIKSVEHYDTCFNSRILSLDDTFQAKLGWLLGNIYSRVGTNDWNDFDKEKFKKRRIEIIKNSDCKWIDGKILNKIPSDIAKEGQASILDYIKTIDSDRDILLKRIVELVNNREYKNIAEVRREKLFGQLRSDPQLSSLLGPIQ
ncbi:MAG: hypothetical protein AB1454_06835 [Candidatus Auribacterota bacterium]